MSEQGVQFYRAVYIYVRFCHSLSTKPLKVWFHLGTCSSSFSFSYLKDHGGECIYSVRCRYRKRTTQSACGCGCTSVRVDGDGLRKTQKSCHLRRRTNREARCSTKEVIRAKCEVRAVSMNFDVAPHMHVSDLSINTHTHIYLYVMCKVMHVVHICCDCIAASELRRCFGVIIVA